ncbi:MAG: hypothetical protein ACR2ND_12275 [Solirubrobacteraceae bacterium]
MPDRTDVTESLQAHPNISKAAEMLGVAASTLSRRADLAREERGERDVVLAPGEVLRLGAIYRRRSLNDLAQNLIDHAEAVSVDEKVRVEAEVESFFEQDTLFAEQEELLRLARRRLPPALVEQIEASLARDAPELPDMIQGYPPMPDSES